MALRNQVTISVDRDFFEKLFEPSRHKIQEQLGIKVSHPRFSRMLLKGNVNLIPKLNFDFSKDIHLRGLNIKKGKNAKRKL